MHGASIKAIANMSSLCMKSGEPFVVGGWVPVHCVVL